MKTTTTWRANFRRSSVQLAAVSAVIGGIETVGYIAQAVHTTLPLWQPIMPPWAFALTSTVLGVAVAIARNIPQEGVE